jgi:hypothetical protein
LPDRSQQRRPVRGDERDQIISARRAAEALFTPKPPVSEQPVPDPSQTAEARKPRVLPTLQPAPIRQQTADAPTRTAPMAAPDIPATNASRLRTLVEYGMTVSQVADLYRVPVETIERILQKT